MRIRRILAIATGLELVAIAAFFALVGLFGFRHDHYDLWNNFAPIWLAVCVAGAALSWFALGRRRARTAAMAVSAATFLVLGVPVGTEVVQALSQDVGRPSTPAHALRVVTLNASADSHSPQATEEVLRAADPDVILLQEPVRLLADKGILRDEYRHRVRCTLQAQCALAIWSKRPIRRWGYKTKRPGDAGLSDLEFLWVETTAPDGRPVTIATTHYIWQLQRGQKGQRALLRRYVAKLPRDDLVLSGDMNLTPWTYAMRKQDRDLKPLSRRTRAVFSWPAFVPRIFMPFPAPLLPIDHLYAGPAWRTVSVERLPAVASDHFGVMVTLAR